MKEGSLVTCRRDFPAVGKLYSSPNPPKKGPIYTVAEVIKSRDLATGEEGVGLILEECPLEPSSLGKLMGMVGAAWNAKEFDEVQPPGEVDIKELLEEPVTA